jgi:hypothetical protein
MLFKNALTFVLVGLATAAPLDLPQITKSINTILDNLAVLDTAVTGLSDSANFLDLLAKSDAVLKAITQGAADISATTPISLVDALKVNELSTKLYNSGDKVVKDLIAKKDVIVKAGKAGDVSSGMVAQRGATVKFGEALKGKLPSLAGSIVDATTKKVTDSLDVSAILPS